MKVVTYEERVAQMHVPGDEEKQLRLAKEYVKRLKRKLKKAPSLDEKLEINAAISEAEQVLRKLRLNIFDLEDMLIAKTSAA